MFDGRIFCWFNPPATGLKLRWTKHLIKITCFHLLGLQHTANTLYKPMTVHCTVFHRTRKNMKSTIYLNICIHNRILKMELLLLLDASSCHLLIPWFTSEVANVQRSWIRQNIYIMYFISLYETDISWKLLSSLGPWLVSSSGWSLK